jgi:hypothetical protein
MTAATRTAIRLGRADAHERDFHTWPREQGARLRAGKLDALGLENLVEEIESPGRTQFDSLVGAWRIVMLHMLKFDHQPSRATRSSAISIATHREAATDILVDSPGLKSRLDEALERAYRRARLEASKETSLLLTRFPQACPYTLDNVLTRAFAIDPDETP